MASPRICSVEGCGKPHYAKGWCQPHWAKWRKYGDPLAGRTHTTKPGEPLAWILAHVSYDGDDCVIWPFAKNSWGYGDLWVNKKHVRANRYMCELAHGPAPSPKHEALHACGNGHLACTNPKHLRWGTSKENSEDTNRHGNTNRGERNGSAKLRKEDIIEIRALFDVGATLDSIAKRFNISRWTAADIKKRKIWGWLV